MKWHHRAIATTSRTPALKRRCSGNRLYAIAKFAWLFEKIRIMDRHLLTFVQASGTHQRARLGVGLRKWRTPVLSRLAKRSMDLFIVALVLPLALPLLALCALLVKLDSPGPVFFNQVRTGRHGNRFVMYKFRTMVANAEALKASLLAHNLLTWPDFKMKNDPRITRVGRILRRLSLDELPQIFNVLRGEMSLVGPRPTSFDARTYSLWHSERLEAAPGITGLWQIMGRGRIDFDDRVRLDIAYIGNQSLLLDLALLLRTAPVLFRGF
jgi:lipopolysaccharide/colanic/teichoic acid biosynthesis glycosyltransferase